MELMADKKSGEEKISELEGTVVNLYPKETEQEKKNSIKMIRSSVSRMTT